ncbi:glycosyltransferase [Novosphingobium sp.]|uniref:glycosyltransferase n=1 Tax=Novosphingobium sp. TaxID=1874826 RepID=UPI0038B745C2
MNPQPTFSVVIPLYNHSRYIEAALHSVLAQTLQPVDIIVVDDGSKDDGAAVAEAVLRDVANAKVVRQENRGAHNAINRAIELSGGSHIAVLNSDDTFKPHKLERCLRLFQRNPTVDLVFGRVEIIDPHGAPVFENETTQWLKRSYDFLQKCQSLPLALLNENFGVTTSNFVFTRQVWRSADGFKNLRYCHDLDFLMAASRHGNLLFDEHMGPHISYRVHPTNTIKETLEKVHVEIAAVIASALDGKSLHLTGDLTNGHEAKVLEDILERKGLAAKIASFIPYRRAFSDRGALYDEISGNRPNPISSVSKSALPLSPTLPSRPDGKKPIVAAIELSNFDKGGLEKVVLDCAIDFRRCGVEPIIISCGQVGHLGSIAASHAIETVKLPTENPEAFYEDLLVRRKVDIAMSHFSTKGYPLFHKLGIPNITFIHNVYAMLSGQALDEFLASDQFVDHYISVSKLATDYAVERLGLKRTKITTIPNGLIIDEHEEKESLASAERSRFGLSESDYVFLNVASYNLHKSHYLMANAMQLILQRRQDIKIVCVGNVIYPPHVEQLKIDLIDRGLENHILMPGYFENVAPLHKMADAFLLPSLIEGWSIAMNEAMFYGKPMILSETGGAPEAIVDNDIGLLLPNEYGAVTNLNSELLDRIGYHQRRFQTAPYLANAMINFADNRESWRQRGLKGRTKVIENFDFSTVTEKYVALCRELIKCAK